MARVLLVVLLSGLSLFAQTTNPAASAHQLFEQEQYTQAVAAYERLPEAEKTAAVLNRLAVSYHRLNRLREAESMYRQVMRLQPTFAAAYNNLGALHYLQRRFADADGQFRRAAQRDPQNQTIRRNIHASRYARENSRAARAMADEFVKKQQHLVEEVSGDFVGVLKLLPVKVAEQALEHTRRADTFAVRKLYEDAVIEYRKSIALDRYDASVVNRLGIAYLQLKKFAEAEQQFRDTLRIDPFFPEVLNNLGFIEYTKKNFDSALIQYNRALRIQPRSATVLMNVGACYFSMARYADGVKAVQQALEVDPKLFQRASAGGGTLIQGTQPNDPLMHFHLARVFAGRGDTDEALRFLYKAVDAGFRDVRMMKSEPAFNTLAADERFTRLLDTLSGSRSSL